MCGQRAKGEGAITPHTHRARTSLAEQQLDGAHAAEGAKVVERRHAAKVAARLRRVRAEREQRLGDVMLALLKRDVKRRGARRVDGVNINALLHCDGEEEINELVGALLERKQQRRVIDA